MFYETIRLHFDPLALGKDNRHVEFAPASMNVVVGPNGAGKSMMLKELASFSGGGKVVCSRAVRDAALEEALAVEWPSLADLRAVARTMKARFCDEMRAVDRGSVVGMENSESHALGHVWEVVKRIEGRERILLSASSSIGAVSSGRRAKFKEPAGSRLDLLFRDKVSLERYRGQMAEMFGLFPVVDPSSGTMTLRLSSISPPPGVEDALSPSAEEFMDHALMPEQLSDGTRTYVGIWGHLLSGKERLVFLDEAGAFLHPPLARKLGKQLTQLAVERKGHVFAATHSPDFVLGCVQAGGMVNVIRLTYRAGASTIKILSADQLLPLMYDPLMRSANVLSSLFYDGVAVCEGDADRAFYQEINERLVAGGQGAESCHFVNAQNWQTIPRIAASLRQLGVPAAMLVDLDAVVHPDFPKLTTVAGVPDSTAKGWGQTRGELARTMGDRRQLKAEGLLAVPEAARAGWRKYIRDLAEYGIFAVDVGELEGWFAEFQIPRGHKSEWIVQMFIRMGADVTKPDYVRPSEGGPWAFVRSVVEWIQNPKREGMPDT